MAGGTGQTGNADYHDVLATFFAVSGPTPLQFKSWQQAHGDIAGGATDNPDSLQAWANRLGTTWLGRSGSMFTDNTHMTAAFGGALADTINGPGGNTLTSAVRDIDVAYVDAKSAYANTQQQYQDWAVWAATTATAVLQQANGGLLQGIDTYGQAVPVQPPVTVDARSKDGHGATFEARFELTKLGMQGQVLVTSHTDGTAHRFPAWPKAQDFLGAFPTEYNAEFGAILTKLRNDYNGVSTRIPGTTGNTPQPPPIVIGNPGPPGPILIPNPPQPPGPTPPGPTPPGPTPPGPTPPGGPNPPGGPTPPGGGYHLPGSPGPSAPGSLPGRGSTAGPFTVPGVSGSGFSTPGTVTAGFDPNSVVGGDPGSLLGPDLSGALGGATVGAGSLPDPALSADQATYGAGGAFDVLAGNPAVGQAASAARPGPGTAPMGQGAAGQDDGDRDRRRKALLPEEEDLWGMGQVTEVPPVLGG